MSKLSIQPMFFGDEPAEMSKVIWEGIDVGYVYKNSKHVTIYGRNLDALDRGDLIAAINRQMGGGYYESTSVSIQLGETEEREEDDEPEQE